MEQQEMTFDLNELMRATWAADTYSERACDHVASMHNLRNRPGFNPTPAGDASAISDTSRQTTGAASNRSVVTSDVQCSMPNLRLDLSALKNELIALSPADPLFDEPVMKESILDNLSLSSSASAKLKALYKDTKACILLLKLCLAELKHGSPPPLSGSAGQPPSKEGGAGLASTQGK
jgi:hypothetical protein